MNMQVITFPSLCACFGGAEWVKFNSRTALVKIPMEPEPVKIPRAKMLPVQHWNSFYLADRALERPVTA